MLFRSVQRILIHDAIYDELKTRLVEKTAGLKMGDPKDEDTFIGPVISEGEATRLENWVNEAVDAGATLLVGGKREGAMLEATLLENAPKGTNIVEEEAFGPVAVISRFSDFDDALNTVNESNSACKPASSPATCTRHRKPGTNWKWAAW